MIMQVFLILSCFSGLWAKQWQMNWARKMISFVVKKEIFHMT